VIRLEEVILDDKCIFMVFEYAEHDLLVRPFIIGTNSRVSFISMHMQEE
jgi:hypothetical protein